MSYTEKNIQVLNDIEHIRLRRGMYIGDASNPHHLFSEAFDNAKDEYQAGYGTTIKIIVDTSKNQYTIIDNGRGIPIGKKTLDSGEDEEIIKILCTKSNSGGKFDSSSYLISAGLHGLGNTLINALSSKMVCITERDGKKVTYDAHKDKLTYGTSKKHGTTISFVPNKKYFDDAIIPLDFIINSARTANAFGIKTTLCVDKQNVDVKSTMDDLFPMETKDISVYHQYPIIYSSTDKLKERIVVYMKYTSDTKDKYYGYTNLLYNSSGGTHVNFISKVITEAWEEYIKKEKIKVDVELHQSDYLVGLRCICACFITNPEFSSQTKERLSVNKNYFDGMKTSIKNRIVKTLQANQKQSKALIKRFEEYRSAQNKLLSRKQISSLIIINEDKPDKIRRRSNVPGLIECLQTKRDNTDLYLVEGLSAIGPITRTRNKNLQAGLPLRGKLMNVAGISIKKALNSEVIRNITNACGCGIGPLCDASKRRYDKIIIASDSDSDGCHIQNLVLSTFVNLLPDMVKEGCVYIVLPPLYGWSDKKGKHYTNNLKDIPKNIRYTRYKGLGEMNDDEYEYCLMNPKTRTLVQVEYPNDIDEFNRILGSASGKRNILEELKLIRYE